VFTPHSAKELPAIYDKILDELKAQYVPIPTARLATAVPQAQTR
jgi:hypothetical protein